MFVKVSIPDLISITAICVTAWITNDHAIGWSMWIGLGSYATGRLVQWIIQR